MSHAVTRHRRRDGRVAGVHARRRRRSAAVRGRARHLDDAAPVAGAGAVAGARRRRCATAAEGLRYRDFLVVALMLDKEDLFPDNWIYIHTPGVQVGRIQNFNNWSAAMVPEPGTTCLGMEYFCFKGDGLWEKPDEELIAQASARARAARPGAAQRRRRRHGDPHAQGLSDLRRDLSASTSTRSASTSTRSRTCTPSAATACTSTTTRITRCSRR